MTHKVKLHGLGLDRTSAVSQKLREAVTNSYDAAAILASISAWSYSNIDDCQRMLVDDDNLGFGDASFVQVDVRNQPLFVMSTAQVIRTEDKKVMIICFRGTEALNPFNWATDVDASRVPFQGIEGIKVHKGFQYNFDAVWKGSEGALAFLQNPAMMEENFDKLNDEQKREEISKDIEKLEAVYITGHSLGGAMAFLGGLYLAQFEKELYKKLRGIYTFGQPFVIDEMSAGRCKNLIGDKLFRYVYYNDIVPHVPTRIMGEFAHIGREFRFTPFQWREVEDGDKCTQVWFGTPTIPFIAYDASSSVLPMVRLLNKVFKSPWSLADHSPRGYMKSLHNDYSDKESMSGLKAFHQPNMELMKPLVTKKGITVTLTLKSVDKPSNTSVVTIVLYLVIAVILTMAYSSLFEKYVVLD